MAKNNDNLVLIGILAVIIGFAVFKGGLFSASPFEYDDYTYYENFETGLINHASNWTVSDEVGSYAVTAGNYGSTSSRNEQSTGHNDKRVYFNTDFGSSDWKFVFSMNGGQSSYGAQVGGVIAQPSFHVVTDSGDYLIVTENTVEGHSYVIEIVRSKINLSNAGIVVNGVNKLYFSGKVKEVYWLLPSRYDYSFAQVAVSSLDIQSVKFKVPYSCDLSGDKLLGMESFVGGSQISLYSTRYTVQSFCLEHPAIVTSNEDKGSTTTSELYQQLAQGKVLTVPAGKTYTLFYTFYNDGSIPMICDTYDVGLNKCVNVTGLVTFCSEGTFSPDIGACVVQPEVKLVCEVGRYDTALDKCVYNPPIQMICPLGSMPNSQTGFCEVRPETSVVCVNSSYNPTTGFCEVYPDSSVICSGAVYNPQTKLCEITPPSTNVCPSGYVYNGATHLCERHPSSSELCSAGYSYNNKTGFCEKLLPSTNVCSEGFVYNSVNGMCERRPSQTIICDAGFVYNPLSNKCEKSVSSVILCDGTYLNGICSKTIEPNITRVCPSNTVLTLDTNGYACVFTPETKGYCVQGTYDALKNACVIVPNMEYLCVNGVPSSDGKSCLVTREERIICSSKYIYDLVSDSCIYNPSAKIECPSGFAYNSTSDLCVNNTKKVVTFQEPKTSLNWGWIVFGAIIIIGGAYLLLKKK